MRRLAREDPSGLMLCKHGASFATFPSCSAGGSIAASRSAAGRFVKRMAALQVGGPLSRAVVGHALLAPTLSAHFRSGGMNGSVARYPKRRCHPVSAFCCASTSLFRESRPSPYPLPAVREEGTCLGYVDVAGGVSVTVSLTTGVSAAGAGLSALSPLWADASMAGWVGSPSLAWYIGRCK
jgi:hypothetical protein